MAGYKSQFQHNVYCYDTDLKGKVLPNRIVDYLQEAATSQGKEVKEKVNLEKNDNIWVLVQWDIEVIKYPKYGDAVVVETAAEGFRRFLAIRTSTIYSQDGDVLVRAKAKWAYIDRISKKNVEIPPVEYNLYGVDNSFNIKDVEFTKVKLKENYEKIKEVEVSLLDIDTNGHVNNSRYMAWLISAIEEDFYKDHKLMKFSIVYKREAFINEKIVIKKSNDSILMENEEGKIICLIELSWEENVS